DAFGRPAIVNAVGSLDVDIILDEGPDSINMLADTFDALRALISSGHSVPPDILLELAPGIDNATRKRLIERLRAPDPMAGPTQQMAMAKETAMLEGMEANIDNMRANAESKRAKTAKEMAEAMGQTSEAQAEMGKAHADMAKTRAEIEKIKSETFENVTDAARNLSRLGR
ncbi:MAG: hypothetical protein ACR2OX_08745, partial [Methyloligellaceae bacterium]